ncbi:carbohydrate-binding module family 1 protein [Pluteus cervinus]|uniref:Carbohydrate-binding module family 1 protein n=1 Tax=Pluteus cervinus TaxID=181527 RepID=A0ACD3AYT2_9AGAR|nr:carbohydrate-binding module family 1 protein [Pluteus cervinus]
MQLTFLASFSILAGFVRAGTVVWSGSFNSYATPADFERWSWANQTGTYQWYIHGSQPASHYLALSPDYKNPAHTSEQRGLKLTIDSGATWNSQMERAELIPQTTANLGTGTLYYHFSVKHTNNNPPDSTFEHQIVFFESHFTEFKYGVGPRPTNLVWMVMGQEKWSTPFTADTWFNFAYEINFSSLNVGLWASTGASPLTKVVNNVPASTYTNSADFHVGVLRIGNTPAPEDWFFSNVYIEDGPITTDQGSGSPPTTTIPTTPRPPTDPTITTRGPMQTLYGQCGGSGWSGPTACASGLRCVAVSPPYYYQCQ